MSENRKRNKRGRLTWASSLCSPAAASAGLAHWPLLCRLRPRQEDGRVPDARARRRATPPASLPACPLPSSSGCPGRRHAAPRPSPTLPCLSLVCSLPPEHHRAELVAAAHRLHSHSLPLASPTRAEAPPRLPRLLRQATRRRTPCGAAIAIVFLLGRCRPPTPIRRLQCVLEPASTPAATAVSSAALYP